LLIDFFFRRLLHRIAVAHGIAASCRRCLGERAGRDKGEDGGGDDQFAQEPAELCVVVVARQGVRRDAMDWRSAMVRTEPTHETLDDGGAYAAGWTISGLATLGTIIAVWMFAI
jgi:hypothetical protein